MKKPKKAPLEAPLPMVPLESHLSPRQWAFVNHPLAWTDPAQAAKDVGYSDTYCQKRAYGLKKELEFYLRPKIEAQVARTGITKNDVLAELAAIATSNFMDYFTTIDTEEGVRYAMSESFKLMPAHMQKVIKRLDFETLVLPSGESIQLIARMELHDKISALKELSEILVMKNKDKPPEDPPELENLEPQELEAIEKVLRGAADRTKQKASVKRDRQAITVKPS